MSAVAQAPARRRALLVRAGERMCAVPLENVVETMRPLPTAPLAGTPAFVTGVAVVRGAPVPVVDLDALLGAATPRPATRFVLVATGARRFALAVGSVAGVAAIDDAVVAAMPLVSDACGSALEAIATRDAELLVILHAARLVPDEAWPSGAAEASPR